MATVSNDLILSWVTKRFGVGFARMAAKSPTFMADLKALKRKKVRICIVPGMELAFCSAKNIYLGTLGRCLYRVLSLAHEKFHRINQDGRYRIASRGISLKQCLSRTVQVEIPAISHSMKVLGELKSAGVRIPRIYRDWHSNWTQRNYAEQRRSLLRTECTTGETYHANIIRTWREANGLPIKKPRNKFTRRFKRD